MSSPPQPAIGSIGWFDLTVPDAEQVRDFYASVVGWKWTALKMQDYDDYCMNLPNSGDTVAGICNKRAVNASIPTHWLMYITVENLEQSLAAVTKLGGKVVVPTRGHEAQGWFAVIQDPAGAVVALYQAAKKVEG